MAARVIAPEPTEPRRKSLESNVVVLAAREGKAVIVHNGSLNIAHSVAVLNDPLGAFKAQMISVLL